MERSMKLKLNLGFWNIVGAMSLGFFLIAGCKSVPVKQESSLQGTAKAKDKDKDKDKDNEAVNLLTCVIGLKESEKSDSREKNDLGRIMLMSNSTYEKVVEAKLMQNASNPSVIFISDVDDGVDLKMSGQIKFDLANIRAPKEKMGDYGNISVTVDTSSSRVLKDFVDSYNKLNKQKITTDTKKGVDIYQIAGKDLDAAGLGRPATIHFDAQKTNSRGTYLYKTDGTEPNTNNALCFPNSAKIGEQVLVDSKSELTIYK
jgi:hypothetical protein